MFMLFQSTILAHTYFFRLKQNLNLDGGSLHTLAFYMFSQSQKVKTFISLSPLLQWQYEETMQIQSKLIEYISRFRVNRQVKLVNTNSWQYDNIYIYQVDKKRE